MEKQVKSIYKEVNYLMYEKHKLDFVVAKNFLLEGKTFEKQAPDLLKFTRDSIANDSYRYLKETGRSTRTSKSIIVYVPTSSVSFSTSESVLSIPYIGVVKYKPNIHFNPLSFEENQLWLRQNIRKIGLQISNNEYVCVVNCMDDEEEQRRFEAAIKKKKKISSLLE